MSASGTIVILGGRVPLYHLQSQDYLLFKSLPNTAWQGSSVGTLDYQFREDAKLKEECSPLGGNMARKMLIYTHSYA